MSCSLVTPMPSSSLTGPLPTSVPPLRPHDESWLQEDIPSFIPSGHGVIRCQLPELQVNVNASNPLRNNTKFFLMAPGGKSNDQPAASPRTARSPRIRLRMRPTTTTSHLFDEMTSPSAFKHPLLPITNTAPKPQQLVTPECVNKRCAVEAKVKVAGLLLPRLANRMPINVEVEITPIAAVSMIGKRNKMIGRNSSFNTLCA